MSLTDQEIDGLIREGASDDEILEVAKAKLTGPQGQTPPIPMSQGRMGQAGQLLWEMSGIPMVGRMGSAIGAGQSPSGADLAQAALTGLPIAGMAKAGVPLTKIAKGMSSGALGAAAGQAALGPEAQAGAAKLDEAGHPFSAMALSLSPAMAGGIAGPLGVGMGSRAGRAGAAVLPGRGGLPEAAKQLKKPIDLPTSGAIAEDLEAGRVVSPDAASKALALKNEIPGLDLNAAEAQYLESGIARTPLKDEAYRARQSQTAMARQGEQHKALETHLRGSMEALTPGGGEATRSGVGGALQRGQLEAVEQAGARVGAAEDALWADPAAAKLTFGYRKNIMSALDGLEDELRLNSKRPTRFGDLRPIFNEIRAEAKKVGNLQDAIELKRIIRQKTQGANDSLRKGSGTELDRVETSIGKLIDEGIENASARMKGNKALANEFMDASRGYWKAKFSPEAKLVQETAGLKGSQVVMKPEDVVDRIVRSTRGEATRLTAAEAGGNLPKGSVAKAAAAWLLDEATDIDPRTGGTNLNYGRVKRIWNQLDVAQKNALFGKEARKVDTFLKGLDVTTMSGRYQPPTGASLPVQLPWMERGIRRLPMGATLMGPEAERIEAVARQTLSKPATAQAAPGALMRGSEAAMRTLPQTVPAGNIGIEERKRRALRMAGGK